MKFVKPALQVVVGIVFGILSMLVLSPGLAALMPSEPTGQSEFYTQLSATMIIMFCVAIAFFSKDFRRVFGKMFLVLGSFTWALPISTFLLAGSVTIEAVSQEATDVGQVGAAIGAGIAGSVMTWAAGIIGFVFGTIFFVIGLVLVLGGKREVVIVRSQETVEQH